MYTSNTEVSHRKSKIDDAMPASEALFRRGGSSRSVHHFILIAFEIGRKIDGFRCTAHILHLYQIAVSP